jgi:hypothetical protein
LNLHQARCKLHFGLENPKTAAKILSIRKRDGKIHKKKIKIITFCIKLHFHVWM